MSKIGRPMGGSAVIDLVQVEKLAQRGLTNEQIAVALGLHENTISNRIKTDKGLRNALNGQLRGLIAVTDKLMDIILDSEHKDNFKAIKYYLESRFPESWGEQSRASRGRPAEVRSEREVLHGMSTDEARVFLEEVKP
jgi:hypothetical protein